MSQELGRLSAAERKRLALLEETISRGIGTFFEVGRALEEVRDRLLHRDTHERWEDYCRERWGFSRVHAFRLIQAAEVVEDVLPRGNMAPATEYQIRPLAPLPAEERRQAWESAVAGAGGGQPTAAEVEEAVEALSREAFEALSPANRLRVVEREEAEVLDRQGQRRERDAADGRKELLRRIAFHLRRAARLTREVGPEGEELEGIIALAQEEHGRIS